MSTPTIDTPTSTDTATCDGTATRADTAGHTGTVDPDAEFDLDIRIFESGVGLDEIIRMTDDGCGATCQSACNSC